MANYDTALATDRMGDDAARESRCAERLEEEAREADWRLFVNVVRSFADHEGWPSVLSAVARAMKDEGAA